ncbi:MAG TPA: ABC transporter ATP-binding protein, partial [Rhizobiales bacterium]|nr:ABC transporter ATP-binding protein [Hyphomicrobiales bacterium]
LVMRPAILLLDEPLSALDLKLRQAMQEEFRRIHRETGGTFIYVTHDQGEAFSLADRLIVMNAGRIEQIGRPHEVYRRPKSLFVARFVGDANVLEGRREAGRVTLDDGPAFESEGRDGRVTFVLRPEDIRLGAPTPDAVTAGGVLRDAVHLGGTGRLTATLPGGRTLLVNVAEPDTVLTMEPGAALALSWPRQAMAEVAP